MVQFQTKIDIPRSAWEIKHTDKVLLLGSCFADEVGAQLVRGGFDAMVNPFGTLYNPASIAAMLLRSIDGQPYTADSAELLYDRTSDRWHSWMHHSRFSSATRDQLISKANETMRLVGDRLRSADVLIITLGTSIIYRLKDSGMLVANCHKQPDSLFERQRLSPSEIVDQWQEVLLQLYGINPNLKVIFTVSPIRHKRDGMHINQISKGILLQAVDELVNGKTNGTSNCTLYMVNGTSNGTCSYFPSYEIMIDELRDYRFYADDMIHPSALAVEYIWQRFQDTYFSNATKDAVAKAAKQYARSQHRTIVSAIIMLICTTILMSCGGRITSHKDEVAVDSDSIEAVLEAERIARTPLPAEPLASVSEIDYSITVFDTTVSGVLDDMKNVYLDAQGQYTFRGNPLRNAAFGGRVKGTPTKVVESWVFKTDFDDTHTSMGMWGGGSGWTGEPVYVRWTAEQMDRFKAQSPALTADFGEEEIMVGSLCGNVYFINFQTGKASRQPIDVTNPIKGSISLDPSLNGNLYVGQGIPKVAPMSQLGIDLFTHQIFFTSGRDPNAWVGWCASDSSPVRVGQFLFWPGENGTIYKYLIKAGQLIKHSTLRFRAKGDNAAGVENSICIYKNYGFFGTNHGDILCIDLNTMQPVWHYDNHDDIDASIVCEVVDDVPYLYSGCEVDRQGLQGFCHLVKLNGLTGAVVWENRLPCEKLNLNGKHFDGGLYSTPLLGQGDCDSLIFANICQFETPNKADFVAFNKHTGDIVYRVRLKTFAWSSPIGFLNEAGKQYIFAGDSSGFAYLIDGKTGEIIFCQHMVNNFESSPVVVGNQFVVGSRGQEIHKFEIQ